MRSRSRRFGAHAACKGWRKLQSDLRQAPRDLDLAATLWDAPVLSEHLRRRCGEASLDFSQGRYGRQRRLPMACCRREQRSDSAIG